MRMCVCVFLSHMYVHVCLCMCLYVICMCRCACVYVYGIYVYMCVCVSYMCVCVRRTILCCRPKRFSKPNSQTHCVAVYCSALQGIAVHGTALQCVAAHFIACQCVAVSYISRHATQPTTESTTQNQYKLNFQKNPCNSISSYVYVCMCVCGVCVCQIVIGCAVLALWRTCRAFGGGGSRLRGGIDTRLLMRVSRCDSLQRTEMR